VAGAAPAESVTGWLKAAGFVDIRVTPRPESRELIATWAPGRGIENHIVSAIVEAWKPGPGQAAEVACCAPSCCTP